MYPSAQSQEDGGHFHRFWSAEWGVCIISGLFIALFLWEIIRWLVFGYLSDFLPFLGRCGSGRFPCKSLYITWKKEHQRCQQELASGLTPEKTPRPNWQWHLCVCVCGVSVCVVCVYFYLFFFFGGGKTLFLKTLCWTHNAAISDDADARLSVSVTPMIYTDTKILQTGAFIWNWHQWECEFALEGIDVFCGTNKML